MVGAVTDCLYVGTCSHTSPLLSPELPDWGQAAQLALEALVPQLVLFLLVLEIQRLQPLARNQGIDIQITVVQDLSSPITTQIVPDATRPVNSFDWEFI